MRQWIEKLSFLRHLPAYAVLHRLPKVQIENMFRMHQICTCLDFKELCRLLASEQHRWNNA
jgi:hypothetical protein